MSLPPPTTHTPEPKPTLAVKPELAQFVRTRLAVDGPAGLDLDGVVAAGGLGETSCRDQPVRFQVRRLTAGLARPCEQAGHDQGRAGPRRLASEGDASGLTMDRRLGSLAW
jgi:hypothetical protein